MNTSQPMESTSMWRCGVRWTPSTTTRAPAAWATLVISAVSGMAPMAFEAPVTATHLVACPIRSTTASVCKRPLFRSRLAMRTVAPASRAASSQGATFESWSSSVQMISSPGPMSAAIALVRAIMLAVVLGPKTIPAGSAPRSSPTVTLTLSARESHSRAAGNAPWLLALFPLRCHSATASMEVSTA